MVGACLLFAAPASAHLNSSPERSPCEHKSLVNNHRHGLADFKRELGGDKNKLRHFRHCSRTPGKREKMRELAKEWRQNQVLAVTPYPGPNGTSWAIPWTIVSCESGGDWNAYNPSGAAGPYQLMPEWGRPYPVDSEADKASHHRIASQVWAGGAGRGNWVC